MAQQKNNLRHSPAPWKNIGTHIEDSNGVAICVLSDPEDGPIIARAPEMLESLVSMVKLAAMYHDEAIGWDGPEHDRGCEICKAIQRAKVVIVRAGGGI